jgi:hypothetical protein
MLKLLCCAGHSVGFYAQVMAVEQDAPDNIRCGAVLGTTIAVFLPTHYFPSMQRALRPIMLELTNHAGAAAAAAGAETGRGGQQAVGGHHQCQRQWLQPATRAQQPAAAAAVAASASTAAADSKQW